MHHIDQQTILHSDVATSVCFSIIFFLLSLSLIRKKAIRRIQVTYLSEENKTEITEVQLAVLVSLSLQRQMTTATAILLS